MLSHSKVNASRHGRHLCFIIYLDIIIDIILLILSYSHDRVHKISSISGSFENVP